MPLSERSTVSEELPLFVDNCSRVLSEVPNSFDFGTLKVKLVSADISKNFISLGSECGALFLFSRKHKCALKPLRTTYSEVITCQRWFLSEERDALAIGHQSGTLIIICLPSANPGGSLKLKQSVHENVHGKKAISKICWSLDGRFVYSCDVTGVILCIDVDFSNEVYNRLFVFDSSPQIRYLDVNSTFLFGVFEEKLILLYSNDQHWILHRTEPIEQKVTGMTANENEIILSFGNSALVRYEISEKRFETIAYLNERLWEMYEHSEIIVEGNRRPIRKCDWLEYDFENAHTLFYEDWILMYGQYKVHLIEHKQFSAFTQRLLVDLRQLKNSDNLEILNSFFDVDTSEVLVLTNTQKLLRLSWRAPSSDLIIAESNNSLFSSISSIAQSSSKKWLQKFTSAGEFQNFEVPIHLRFPDTPAIVEQYSSKIASNLNTVFEHFKTPAFGDTEIPNTEKEETEQKEEKPEEQKPLEVFETKVEVKRRIRKRRGNVSTDSATENSNSIFDETEEQPKICTENLDKIFRVLEFGEKEERLEEKPEEEENREELSQPAGQPTDQPTGQPADQPAGQPNSTEPQKPIAEINPDNSEIEAESSFHSADEEDQTDLKPSESEEVEETEWDGLSSESLFSDQSAWHSVCNRPNAEYEAISALADSRTDVWNRIKLPFEATWFDVCANYLVICSNRRFKRPHFRLFEPIDNAILGGSWTPLKFSASMIAVNDDGLLLWRVESGVAYAPYRPNPFTPFSLNWLEQANEGQISAISMTSKSAWYLTDRGPFVQMNLPDMGILYRAECPFQLSEIVASDKAVWALRSKVGTLIVRVGLKHCPMGVDWVEDSLSGPTSFVSIALYNSTGFGLDSLGCLWMCGGVDEDRPFGVGAWFQMCSPLNVVSAENRRSLSPPAKWRLRVSGAGVFILAGKYILSARQPLTSHTLSRTVPQRISLIDDFSLISASGFTGDLNDCVYVGHPNSEIFAFSARQRNLTSMPSCPTATAIVALSAIADRLYVLDAEGNIHIRVGINSHLTPRGTDWLRIERLPPTLAIISFAVSATFLFAVGSDGSVWLSPNFPIATECKWSNISTPADLGAEERIDQCRCSPNGRFLWLTASASNRAWASVMSESGSAAEWTEVCNDVAIGELAVADDAVYCLSAAGSQLHRLRCVSAANPAGLYWKPLPLRARAISVDSFEQRLWAIDLENRLCKHQMQIHPRAALEVPEEPAPSSAASPISASPPVLFDVHGTPREDSWFDVTK